MLVLSRRVGESVMVGDDIDVAVVALRPGRVVLEMRRTKVGSRITLEDSYQVVLPVDGAIGLPTGGTCVVRAVDEFKARLGFPGVPKDVSIHRREVYEAIQRKNERERGQP